MTENQRFSLIWAVVSFIVGVITVTNNTYPPVILAGFFAKTFAVIVGTGTGLIGAAIGEAIRRFALPDGYFTNGGITSIVKTKLFWMIGPQSIGMFIGVVLGIAIVLM